MRIASLCFPTAAALSAAAILFLPASAFAQSLSSVVSGTAYTDGSGPSSFNPNPTTDGTLIQGSISSFDTTDANTYGTCGAKAQTAYGTSKASATAQAGSNGASDGYSNSEGTSTWTDIFTLNKAGATGTAATITYSFAFSGKMLGDDETASLLISRASAQVGFSKFTGNNGVNSTVVTNVLNVVYGTPFTISAKLDVTANASTLSFPPSSKSSSDFLATGGAATLTLITVNNGGTDPTVGITTASNAPYSGVTVAGGKFGTIATVPEVGTFSLLSLAFCGGGTVLALRKGRKAA